MPDTIDCSRCDSYYILELPRMDCQDLAGHAMWCPPVEFPLARIPHAPLSLCVWIGGTAGGWVIHPLTYNEAEGWGFELRCGPCLAFAIYTKRTGLTPVGGYSKDPSDQVNLPLTLDVKQCPA